MPIVQYIDIFEVKGFSTKTKNSDEFNEKSAKIPLLWQQFYASDLAINPPIFGVYSHYESNENGFYTVTAGVICNKEQSPFNMIKVEAGNYLMFQGLGPMPKAVINTWQEIWRYFESENGYQRNFMSDFEEYKSPSEVNIYIGIKS